MKMRRASRAWMKNRDALLWLVLSFSVLLFFGCLLLIPQGDGGAVLRGGASLLALCLPALFYLRSENGETFRFLGAGHRRLSPVRVLLLCLGALLLGIFIAELLALRTAENMMFSRFSYSSFSLASAASALCYAFSSALLSFGFLGNRLSEKSLLISLLAPSVLFASLSASPRAMPFLFLFGVALMLIRRLSDGFLPALLATLCLVMGGYTVAVGGFGAFHFGFLPRPVFLIIVGVLALSLLLGAIGRAFFKDALGHALRSERTGVLLWSLFSLFVLALSLCFSLLFTKLIG